MEDVIGAVATVVAFGMVLAGLPWLAARARRRGVGAGGVMGPFEELWHPAAQRARLEVEVQQEQAAPAPSPGDLLPRGL